MKRWKRKSDDDDDDDDLILKDDDDDDDEDEEDEEDEEERRPRIKPRPLAVTRFSDFEYDEDDDPDKDIKRFNQIEGLIRAGRYKPKQSDPWMAHILYANLKALDEI
jgi:hypothetical protein